MMRRPLAPPPIKVLLTASLLLASLADVGLGASSPASAFLLGSRGHTTRNHRLWASKYNNNRGGGGGGKTSTTSTTTTTTTSDVEEIVFARREEGGKALVTLKSGAYNRSIPAVLLNRAMDVSLETRLPGEEERPFIRPPPPPPTTTTRQEGGGRIDGQQQREDDEDDKDNDMPTPHGHLLSPFHPVFGRWELAFVSFKRLPPFYVPVPNMITLTRDGPGRILAHATAFDEHRVAVPLGTFTVTENSMRTGRPMGCEESDGVLYGMQLSSIKPGKKVFDLVLYKEDDGLPVLAVRSTDGEEAWLLLSVEARMRRRDANVRKYAREILNLERQSSGGSPYGGVGGRDNASGYRVMRDVWKAVFQQIDSTLGTRLSTNSFLLSMSPFLPILFLGVFMFLTSPLIGGRFGGEMSFLHHRF